MSLIDCFNFHELPHGMLDNGSDFKLGRRSGIDPLECSQVMCMYFLHF